MQSRHDKRLKLVALLAIATPGIPEYLTGSWKLSSLFSNPLNFTIFLILNIGLYTSGALLVREYSVAFRKGWLSVFILGCAYGIVEEAIALHTFFQVTGNPVGFLGYYGRFAGVDWVWAFGLTVFHAIFSITLPILLISIAYPESSTKRLTGGAGAFLLIFIYSISVLFLNFTINRTSTRPVPTSTEYLLFLVISLVLVIIAYFIPRDLLHFRGKVGANSFPLYILGLLIYPIYNIFAFIPVDPEVVTRIRPIFDVLIHLVLFGVIVVAAIHLIPGKENRKQKFALAAGIITSLVVESLKLEFSGAAPFIGIIDLIAVAFLYRLWTLVNETKQCRTVDTAQSG